MKLIVGLGNPGKKYEKNRHNIGYIIVDYLYDAWLKKENCDNWSGNSKFQGEMCIANLAGNKIILVKPTTFMNNSGHSVQALTHYFKVEPKDIIVIHDELALPFGNYKVQTGKSSAGHKGVESIITSLGSQDFTRIRIGVAKDNKAKQGNGANFVLGNFSFIEKLKLGSLKDKVLEEIKKLV